MAQDPESVLRYEFLLPIQFQNMLQQSSAQIHIQRSAGIGIRRNAPADHGRITAHILDQFYDLRIAETVIFCRNTPVGVIFRIGHTGDLPAQQS